jgi:hypothetical protein
MYTNAMFVKSARDLKLPVNTVTCTYTNKMAHYACGVVARQYCYQNPVEVKDPGTWRERGMLMILATMESAGKTNTPVADNHKDFLYQCHSKITKELSTRLFCLLGNVYRMDENTQVHKGKTNGTLCYLENVILKHNTEVRFFTLGPEWGYGIHYVYSSDVLGLIMRYDHPRFRNFSYDTSKHGDSESEDDVDGHAHRLRPGTFSLLPQSKTVSLNFGKGGVSPLVRITGFCVRMANVRTTDSLQGLTIDFLVILDFGSNWRNRKGHVFMTLTRVATRGSYRLMNKLPEDPSYYPTRWNVMEEQDRLRIICDRTYRVMHDLCDLPDDALQTSVMSATAETYKKHRPETAHLPRHQFSNFKVHEMKMLPWRLVEVRTCQVGILVVPATTKNLEMKKGDIISLTPKQSRCDITREASICVDVAQDPTIYDTIEALVRSEGVNNLFGHTPPRNEADACKQLVSYHQAGSKAKKWIAIDVQERQAPYVFDPSHVYLVKNMSTAVLDDIRWGRQTWDIRARMGAFKSCQPGHVVEYKSADSKVASLFVTVGAQTHDAKDVDSIFGSSDLHPVGLTPSMFFAGWDNQDTKGAVSKLSQIYASAVKTQRASLILFNIEHPRVTIVMYFMCVVYVVCVMRVVRIMRDVRATCVVYAMPVIMQGTIEEDPRPGYPADKVTSVSSRQRKSTKSATIQRIVPNRVPNRASAADRIALRVQRQTAARLLAEHPPVTLSFRDLFCI